MRGLVCRSWCTFGKKKDATPERLELPIFATGKQRLTIRPWCLQSIVPKRRQEVSKIIYNIMCQKNELVKQASRLPYQLWSLSKQRISIAPPQCILLSYSEANIFLASYALDTQQLQNSRCVASTHNVPKSTLKKEAHLGRGGDSQLYTQPRSA